MLVFWTTSRTPLYTDAKPLCLSKASDISENGYKCIMTAGKVTVAFSTETLLVM